METNEYWVHDLSPFLIEFPTTIFGIEGIRYYGVAYLIGFFAVWYFLKICEQKGKLSLNAKDRSDLMTYLILGVLIGGRLGYVLFYDFQDSLKIPFCFFASTKAVWRATEDLLASA